MFWTCLQCLDFFWTIAAVWSRSGKPWALGLDYSFKNWITLQNHSIQNQTQIIHSTKMATIYSKKIYIFNCQMDYCPLLATTHLDKCNCFSMSWNDFNNSFWRLPLFLSFLLMKWSSMNVIINDTELECRRSKYSNYDLYSSCTSEKRNNFRSLLYNH